MGKYQIKSYCQISNHSINRLKSVGQISNPIFFVKFQIFWWSQIKSRIFNFRFKLDTFVYLFFHDIKNNVIQAQWVSDDLQLLQYS